MEQPSGFKILPEQNELDQVPRELRFFPSTGEKLQTLSKGEVDQFNRVGYLKPFSILENEEISDYRWCYFDRLLEKTIAAGGDSYSISTAHLSYGRAYDLLTHPKIVALVCDILGENVVGWGSHFFCKMPHDGKSVAWHQDASYWPLSPSKTVTVWLAIDDADRGNGCMRFLKGSHLEGHIPYRESDAGEGNVLDQSVDDVERFGEPEDVVLRAGELSLHSDLLLHGSEANDSDRRRCGLTLRYCTADVKAGMDWNAKGVVVSGEDSSKHWANPARPEND